MGRGFLRWFVVVLVAALSACGAPPGNGGTIGGVTVAPTTATIAVDETVQLTATLTGVVGYPNLGIGWVSADTSKATVSSTGLVTGKAPGAVVITATSVGDPSKSAAATVTVTLAPAVTGVSIDQPDSGLLVGGTLQLTVTVAATGGADEAVTWASGNEAVAAVSAAGLVSAVSPGTAVITATSVVDAGQSDSITITVTDPGGAGAAVMLIPNFVSARIEILRQGGPLDQFAMSTPLATVLFPTAVAVGPDGRVYVASVAANPADDSEDPFDDAGIVIYPPAALQGGTVAPVAVLTSPLLGNPFALTFDANGTLWVGNTWQNGDPDNPFPEESFRDVAFLAFRDVASITADAERAPDVVFATFQGQKGEDFFVGWTNQIESFHLDADGNLWVTDRGTVTRIDDLAGIVDGTVLDLVPGTQIQIQFAGVTDPNDNSILGPFSAVVDGGGRLYVGNSGNNVVSRFDDAASLSGVVVTQPTLRFFVDGVTTPSLMSIDAEGGLWFGYGTGDTLRRVASPETVADRATAAIDDSVVYTPGFGSYASGGITFASAP